MVQLYGYTMVFFEPGILNKTSFDDVEFKNINKNFPSCTVIYIQVKLFKVIYI